MITCSVEVKDKPVCPGWGEVFALMKRDNLEGHYSLKHTAALVELLR